MKFTFLWVSSLFLLSLFACVPAKQLNDLQNEFKDLQEENERLSYDLERNKNQLAESKEALEKFTKDKEDFEYALQRSVQERDLLQEKYDNLSSSYEALEKTSSFALQENAQKNRALLREIEEKQEELSSERTRLEALQKKLEDAERDLNMRSQRIDELEEVIAAQKKQMTDLKDKISAALTNFEGKGLEVYQKDGKVYVSMENKLLFSSGSWEVNERGAEAVAELAKVLAENPDINVLIEGHTDTDPYNGSGVIQNNWDLSTKRATAVVQILLQNKQIHPKNITAAGRGEFAPVADNTTPEGKAKNRRIEVILTPKLEQLSTLLDHN